jgi:hypothetical protein
MSTFNVPNREKEIIQSNEGDYRGNIWSTFNIDMDSNHGVMKVSKRLERVLGADDIGSDIVQALQIHDGDYYVTTNDRVLSCSVSDDPTDASNWSTISTLGSENLGLETDTVSFSNLLLFSLGTDIMSWDGTTKDDDWWTNTVGAGSLTSQTPHIMEVIRTQKDTLFVTDGSEVRYYEDGGNVTAIQISPQQTATCLTSSLSRMWVGSSTEVEEYAQVYEIVVGEDFYEKGYPVDGRVCLAMFTYKNTPFVITDSGYIQAFNGAGFQTVSMFPWATESQVMEGCRPGLVQPFPTARAIHPKGAKVKGKYCYIYVNTDDEFIANDRKLDARSPSGVWVLDLETYSLTHRYALTEKSTDFGQHVTNRSGPLLVTNTPDTRLMVGGSAVDEKGVWMESETANQAYFTTIRHESGTVADTFETLVIKADTLGENDSVELKYKPITRTNFPLTITDITWLNETQFTTTNTLTGVQDATDEVSGDEVEIILGHRAGNLANIVSIEGGTTKTVTIDESYGVLNEKSDVQIDRWLKVPTEYIKDEGEYKKFGIGVTAPAMAYKVVINGEVTIREVISKSNSKVEL